MKLYESVNEIIKYHEKQENCIWQNTEESLPESYRQLDLVRLYIMTAFSLITFLEGRFREIIWVADTQDKISQELQSEFKQRKSDYVNFTKILKHLDQILENFSPEQLDLPPEAIKQLQRYIVQLETREIGFRNWYAHGLWDINQQREIFDSDSSIELTKCQKLYHRLTAICRDFEKHIFKQPEKL